MARPSWLPSNYYAAAFLLEPGSMPVTMYEITTAGTSGIAEPAWPAIVGATVTDGTAVWTTRAAQTITWQASVLFQTGATEPIWPLGGTVVDGSVTWTGRSSAVTDVKCPQSKLAFSISSKVYSPYNDVTRYSATNDPRDWSSADDAGFIPTGQHAPESVEVTALGEYRGRLAIWTSSHLQIWTTDPDPAEISLFDSVAGVGTEYGKAIAASANDLQFLTKKGIKSLSIAAGATNLATSDVGTPIDSIIQVTLATFVGDPIAMYYPGSGQSWFAFNKFVYVYSNSQIGKVGGWSEYEFAYPLEYHTGLTGNLYIRSGMSLYRMDEFAVSDDGVVFDGVVWWPYLDLGSPGVTKMLHGIDVVGYGTPSVQIGFNQANTTQYTTSFLMPSADTLLDGIVPTPVAGPSFSLKLTYAGGQSWSLLAAALYLDDFGVGV